jgi:diguanylate cyclase (GGDEF)-like protein
VVAGRSRAGVVGQVTDVLPIGLLVTTEDGEPVWSNPALRELLAEDPVGLLAVARPGPGEHVELPWPPRGDDAQPRAGDCARWLNVDCTELPPTPRLPADEAGPAPKALRLLQVTDITGRRAVADRERRLARLEALGGTGSWEWNVASNEVEWSDELRRMFGFPPDAELNYKAYRELIHPEDVKTVERTLARALEAGESFRFSHRMASLGGAPPRVFECHGDVLADGGKPARLLVSVRDVTIERQATRELAYLADHDPLTGLLNRHAITTRLRAQLAAASRGGALLLIDLDNFSDLNDLRGHAAGDQVMRGLAELLANRLESGAALGRLSGDEFAIILPSGDAGDALGFAESLCDAIARHPFVAGRPGAAGSALRITASIGVAPLAPAGDCDVLLANADLALSEAKSAGRNRARVFAPEQYQLAVKRVSVMQRATDALDKGLMVAFAQPVVDLSTRQVTSHELLVRMRDGIDPALSPAEFLPAMERTDLVCKLDRWMVEQGVSALATPQARSAKLRLQVNVSTKSLEDPGFGDFVVSTLNEASVEPARLGLEITETAAITNLAAARRLANRLTRAGCRFALDDFGAGFGSFTYLKHLPFTSVKIDGEFVRQADRALGDAVFVEAVVTVARGLNMLTIAEYVDREALVTKLAEMGVDRGQGFHLGKPRPLADLLEETAARTRIGA